MASKLKTSDNRVVILNYVRTAPIFQKNLKNCQESCLIKGETKYSTSWKTATSWINHTRASNCSNQSLSLLYIHTNKYITRRPQHHEINQLTRANNCANQLLSL